MGKSNVIPAVVTMTCTTKGFMPTIWSITKYRAKYCGLYLLQCHAGVDSEALLMEYRLKTWNSKGATRSYINDVRTLGVRTSDRKLKVRISV